MAPRRRRKLADVLHRRSEGCTSSPPAIESAASAPKPSLTTTIRLLRTAVAAAAVAAGAPILLLLPFSSLAIGGASAFRLTSLLPLWDTSSGGVVGGGDGEDDDDPLAALAYPRRNLAKEWGDDAYREKIARALGRTAAEEDGVECEEGGGAPRCAAAAADAERGADVSFPMHHPPRPASPMPAHRRAFYDDFLRSCREACGPRRSDECDRHESDRLDMSRNQPRVMINYTDVGVLKTRAPGGLYRRLRKFWDENRSEGRKVEKWGRGNTYVNHWDSPTYMVNLDNSQLPGGGMDLRNAIWDGARQLLTQWTGVPSLTASSLYGIRVYETGAVLAPHVDRLPLVTSAIINIDQDVDEPWPLEVIAHDGIAYNITLEPGEMVLYESHSIIHGRPYPLKGRFYANVFVHFEPRGHSQRHGERMEAYMRDGRVTRPSDEELYRRAIEKAEAERAKAKTVKPVGQEDGIDEKDGLPDYIARGTPEEKRWKQEFVRIDPGAASASSSGTITLDAALPKGRSKRNKATKTHAVFGANAAHHAASTGDVEVIRDIAASPTQRVLLFKQDKNGWQPLHEAARGGYDDIVEVLLDEGADVNVRTNQGRGGNALWWAEKTHGRNHVVCKLLRKRGGKSIPPNKPAK